MKQLKIILTFIYSAPQKGITLNKHRFNMYTKCDTKNKINLASFHPTEDTVKRHSYRVYFQLQLWLGNIKIQKNGDGYFKIAYCLQLQRIEKLIVYKSTKISKNVKKILQNRKC